MTSGVFLLFSRFSRVLRGFTPWALGILIIGGTLIALTAQHPQVASAAWYDDTFVYRRAIRFGNTGATVTDQKVLIEINTSSTSGLIQDERMQTDCDDTRFTDANGLPLQYYINVGGGAGVGCNDTSTDYYVLMPRIEGGGDTLIYMYYGNYNAVSASAGANFSQATFTPTSGPSIAAEETGTAPLLYWNFDEGYGTTANDLMIQRNNGTITGSWATEDRCVSGKCIQMNGSSHKVIKTYASDFELDVSSNSFTVSLWMRHASALAGTDTLVSRVSSGGYKIAASSGSFCFAIDDDAAAFDPDDSACTSSTYNDSTWHQVTAVKNGTTSITLYVDGNQVAQDASLSGTGSLSGSSPEFDVGVDGSSNFFDGAIDEVKVYNTAKTAAQIKAEYSSRSATGEGTAGQIGSNQIPFSNGLVGYWRMDEKGQNDCDGTNDTCDVSGNANHGAWTNGAIDTDSGKFGSGVWFDGTTDYVSVADSTSLSVTTQFSLGLWINSSTSVASESLVVKNNSYRLVTDANSNPVCQVSDGTTWQTAATSTTALTTSAWYHVGCSYDGQTIRVFVNGAETGRNALASSIGDNANALEFGRDAGGTYTDFGGVLDEVRLYNRGLSPKEIEQIYNFGPGPVGWWKMDENTGTAANDSSGNANNGTLTLGPAWQSGKFGAALDFDGTNDYINAGTNAILDLDSQLTVSAWINPQAVVVGTIMVQGKRATKPFVEYQLATLSSGLGQKIRFSTAAGRTAANSPINLDSTSTYSLNTWVHVAGVWDGSNMYLYINGTLNNSIAATGTNFEIDNQSYIGGDVPLGEYFNGPIDDVRVYNYARTAKQIVEDMLGGRSSVTSGGPNAGQIAYWKFDEGQGTTANNSGFASSSNGTLTNIASPATSTSGWTFTGKVNKGIIFDGSNDNVVIATANDAAVDFATTEQFGASAWVYVTTMPGSGNQDAIIAKWDDTGNLAAYKLYVENDDADTTGNFEVQIYDESASQTITASQPIDQVAVNTWYHVAFTFNGGTAGAAGDLTLYVNGNLTAQNAANTSFLGLEDLASDFTVGDYDAGDAVANNTAFTGTIDEVKVYSGLLSQSEIQIDMNAGSAAALGGVLGTQDNEGFGGNPPVGWWKMDENTGTTSTFDSSGNSNTGTMNGASTSDWVPGKYGSALYFDGATKNVDISPITNDIASGNFSVSLWFNPANTYDAGATLDQHIFSFADAPSNNDIKLLLENVSGSFRFHMLDSTSTSRNIDTTQTSWSANTWYHIETTFSTTDGMKLYVNGILNGTNANTSRGSVQTTQAFLAVQFNGNADYSGRIDDVRVYNYARTPAQIAYDYNRGAPVGWWKFDECQGATAYNSALNANNEAAGMNGTITLGASGQTTTGDCTTNANTPWYNGRTGKYNASLNFDGTDDYVNLQSPTAFDDMGPLTISAWIKPNSLSGIGNRIVDKTNFGFEVYNPGNMDFWSCWGVACATPNSAETANVLSTGIWQHVVVTWDGTSSASNIRFYVNGKSVGAANTTNGSGSRLSDATANLTVGIEQDLTNPFDGQIDDLKIWNYELTSAQIKRLYNEGAAIRFGPQSGSP